MGDTEEARRTMKFDGVEHEQIELPEAEPGDYFFWDGPYGRQVGKLARIDFSRGRCKFVTTEVTAKPGRLARRAQGVQREQVVSVWRRMRRRKCQ